MLEQLQVLPQSLQVRPLIMDLRFLYEFDGISVAEDQECLPDGSLLDHAHDQMVVELYG